MYMLQENAEVAVREMLKEIACSAKVSMSIIIVTLLV